MPPVGLGRHLVNQRFVTAREAGLVGCTDCGSVWSRDLDRCGKCNARLTSRPRHGLEPVWAWWLAGVLFYIPANVFPMLVTKTLGREEQSTIIGGVVELANHGSWGIAAIVFFASVVIPVGKFAAIAALALAVRAPRIMSGRTMTHTYELVELIGRWSMIDIFVVAILSALVQLGWLASLHPGPAAASFTLSVAFTMLSARAFDSRLYWDAVAVRG